MWVREAFAYVHGTYHSRTGLICTLITVRGILFKLAKDVQLSSGQWLYGGLNGHNYELSAKAAGHDLRGATQAYRFHSLGLHVPTCCLVDYHGFRYV